MSDEEKGQCVASVLLDYVKKTEIPILSEFCVQNDLYEEFLLQYSNDSSYLRTAILFLENKKRASLERKIYSGELNATIGAHLMKTWREIVVPEPPAKFRVATITELDELDLTNEEIAIYAKINRALKK